jgi:flavin reductase (DIM6/NTAB) family NADH-FMN oxidoreductase RutF
MAMKSLKPNEGLYPSPVILLTTVDESGNANVMSVAWAGVISSIPPQISVSIYPTRHSHHNLVQTGEFVAAIPSEAQLLAADFCGCVSGKDVDKFAEANLTKVPAEKVAPPLIAECPVNLECVVRQMMRLGDDDVFVGEVVAVHADEAILDEQGKIDYSKAKPLAFILGEYWTLGKRVGREGFSIRERKSST